MGGLGGSIGPHATLTVSMAMSLLYDVPRTARNRKCEPSTVALPNCQSSPSADCWPRRSQTTLLSHRTTAREPVPSPYMLYQKLTSATRMLEPHTEPS